jgi:hypothetical protein
MHRSKVPCFLAEWPRGVEEHKSHFGVCANERLEERGRGSGKKEFWITQASVELHY